MPVQPGQRREEPFGTLKKGSLQPCDFEPKLRLRMNHVQLGEKEINKGLIEESSQAGAERLLRMILMIIMNEMEAKVYATLLLIPIYSIMYMSTMLWNTDQDAYGFILKEIMKTTVSAPVLVSDALLLMTPNDSSYSLTLPLFKTI